MSRLLNVQMNSWPIAGTFTISRGSKTTAEVVTCNISESEWQGSGECVPYRRYGETIESVISEIESVRTAVESGMTREELAVAMKPGAARNAVDCALWDLEAKRSGISVARTIGLLTMEPRTTAFTISLGEPEVMAAAAGAQAHRTLLKVKIGTSDDESRIRAVRMAAPQSAIILDANEGWTEDNLARHLEISAEAGIALVEQPLPAGNDRLLATIRRPVPVCADESVHHTGDLESLRDRYDAINIKLDKTGGLTEALRMKADGERLGFRIMVGCMVGTSLAMAPALMLAQDAAFVDLDGPLLLSRDREPGLRYEGSLVFPPLSELWG
ncbi:MULTISPECIES: N-acetyl-D-Glu racemase DgcA [unclassified Rhizobium]|uniref:N-acetyl-D-Glu racemase DgcA n=1 Tax=unclassified Rhizobium TaxID=2613769 RepID=UPI001AD99008|nr:MULTISPECIES: N-acetyl-D-Glu racemase DgcA [unclassified Rhizobium]MBO9098608.1 dipeptide epimerase [Rhizobium sp. L58/93]MBO9132586.1 dipeptide epimerase [Rhizobium sp. B209b/85]MBO9184824.1 dipeptide epimerase [Rhizobium sp. E27B/91]QXZ84996.1 dipeptide epimerase [Rhizobium sp. K1/93]QXZ90865.1 dipeptide epimerase [Rhizobium sp. K15/93]